MRMLLCLTLCLPALCGCDGPSLLKAEQTPVLDGASPVHCIGDWHRIDNDTAAFYRVVGASGKRLKTLIALSDKTDEGEALALSLKDAFGKRIEVTGEWIAAMNRRDDKDYLLIRTIRVVGEAEQVPVLDGTGETVESRVLTYAEVYGAGKK